MDADEAMALIRARIPEFDPVDLATIGAALRGEVIPADALAQVLALVDGLESRMDALAPADA